MKSERSSERAAGWQGQNWIRPERRLAIYLRDGLACVWCSQPEGVVLTLDHVRPYAAGGGHEATNLVTSCHRCNSRPGRGGVGAGLDRRRGSFVGRPRPRAAAWARPAREGEEHVMSETLAETAADPWREEVGL